MHLEDSKSFIQLNNDSKINVTVGDVLVVAINQRTGKKIKSKTFHTNHTQLIQNYLIDKDSLGQIIAVVIPQTNAYTFKYQRLIDIDCQIPLYQTGLLCLQINQIGYINDAWELYQATGIFIFIFY